LTLAMLFEAGEGWPHDAARARHWYEQAALHGSAAAQVNLAYLHAEGIGTHVDVLEACALLAVAIESGSPVARANREVLCAALDAAALAAVDARAARYRQDGDTPLAVRD
ncbi:MAG: hypothetical protein RLW62_01420, partial [Gammaproteobacteria bacterium]